jgi:hypothetical protein
MTTKLFRLISVVIALGLAAHADSIPSLLAGGVYAQISGNGSGITSNYFAMGSRWGSAVLPGIDPVRVPCGPNGFSLVVCHWTWATDLSYQPIRFELLPATTTSAPFPGGYSFSGFIDWGFSHGTGSAACLATCELNLTETSRFSFIGDWTDGWNEWASHGSFSGNLFYQSGGPTGTRFMSTYNGLVEPVPEPGTLLLVGTSALGLAGIVRKRGQRTVV